jgi:sortase (surface protein transpeptidase)
MAALGVAAAAAAGSGWAVTAGVLPLPGLDRAAPAAAIGGPAVAVRPSTAAAATPSADANGYAARARALLAPAARPTQLVIPALGVNAVVESVAVDAQGRMGTPSQPDHVAWYDPGAAPGDPGNAVIDGHLDWTSGPAVFWHLSRLHAGDQVTVVRADGTQVRFVVDSSTQVPFDARTNDLFTRTGPPALSLVTCAGAWDRARSTYLTRLVVHATLAPSEPTDKPGDEGG